MVWIVWIILALYSLPLLGIPFSVIATNGFRDESVFVHIFGSIAVEFLQNLRDIFGSMIVPLLMAFAVRNIGANDQVPRRTMAIFATLAALFFVSVVSVGLVKTYEDGIKHHDPKVYEAFGSVTRSYSKELLTYIALTLGISLRKE